MSDKQAQKVTWVLTIIKELDPIPAQYFKKLVNTDDIWEVRVTLGNNIFRLLGFFAGQDFVVLTNAFQKKTQKTPREEIKLAEVRKKEYLNRRSE